MADWQVGDRALCVTDAIAGFGFSKLVVIGRVYTVEDVYVGVDGKYDGVVALVLRGIRGRRYPGLHHALFRKFSDHVPDEEDAETIRLLNGAPVGEPVA